MLLLYALVQVVVDVLNSMFVHYIMCTICQGKPGAVCFLFSLMC